MTKPVTSSKYIKNDREPKFMHILAILLLVSIEIMPPYFGIPTPGFALTAVRIMLLVVLFMIMANKDRFNTFRNYLKKSTVTKVIAPFVFVTFYTAVLRTDVKAFLNPFIEFALMYLTIYVIKDTLGIEKTIKIMIVLLYILTIQGVIEYFTQESLFKMLGTIKELMGVGFVRSGQYRIMGPCVHSLAYALLLVLAFPLISLDLEKKEVYLFKRPIIFMLVFLNVILTGSRSALGVFLIECFLIFLFSNSLSKKKTIFYTGIAAGFLVVFLIIFGRTSIGSYILLQFTSVIDGVFGTSISLQFGGNDMLEYSSSYRKLLLKIFSVSWLNPLLGRGTTSTIRIAIDSTALESIDNYYVGLYIFYAYPGMFSFIFILAFYLFRMLKHIIKTNNYITKALIISFGAYALSIYWVDVLSTLKNLYIILALFICIYESKDDNTDEVQKVKYEGYIKQ
ncbi:MAG: hypothetical protein K6A23_11410 [Butyrivibrio sp.]|nr:hypothetical protein [Butyrivibrio sp.]